MPAYEVVLQGKQGNSDMLNVFHYDVPLPTPPDWQAGADEIREHLSNRLAPLASTNVTWTGISVRLDEVGQVAVVFPFTLGVLTGSNATPSQIRETAVLVYKRSTAGVRPVLGWFFQGGMVVDGAAANGLWESTITDAVLLYAEDIRILGNVVVGSTQMVIKARNPAAPNTQPYTLVDVMTLTDNPRTVRSRNALRGS